MFNKQLSTIHQYIKKIKKKILKTKKKKKQKKKKLKKKKHKKKIRKVNLAKTIIIMTIIRLVIVQTVIYVVIENNQKINIVIAVAAKAEKNNRRKMNEKLLYKLNIYKI